ncbi:MAG: MerR family transcriptional regulator [Candidatus Aminicenantales bacterium]
MSKSQVRQYRVKEFAELTKVTIRALHHYDHIGLLRPSRRTESGYRLYTDRDLVRLQQIVTLKFMGFSLENIKAILARPQFAVKKALRIQVAAVREEIERLRKAARALEQVADVLEKENRIDWKKLIRSMEVIQMSEETKKEWTKKFFTEADMKEFEEIGKKYTPETMQDYQNRWTKLIAEVQKNLDADPASAVAQDLSRRWSELLDQGYRGHEGLLPKIGQAYNAAWKSGEMPVAPGGKPPFDERIWEFIQKANAIRKAK